MVGLLLFILFLILLFMRVPIGVAIGIASIATIFFSGTLDLTFVARSMVTAYDSFPLLAVPLFILAGVIMSRSGISERILDLAALFVGRFTGGVPMATVLACLLFGALSGSGAADTAAIGSIMIPAMVKMGYKPVFAASLVAASGALAVVMPPSLPVIMYGVSANASIGQLFMAGILPAFLIGALLMVYCHIYCKVNGYTSDKMAYKIKNPWYVLRRSILPMLLPIIVLGGIYSGVFTPTEAAGVAVFYSMLIAILIMKTIKITQIYDLLKDASIIIGPIMIILGAATIFSRILTAERIPNDIANFIIGFSDSPIIFLVLVNLLMLFVGVFMETLSSIIILTPVLVPIAIEMGIDPIHFGLIMVVNLAIGFITPPMAGNLFIVSSISGVPVEKLSKGIIIPFLILIFGLLLITYFPFLTTFLPGLMF